MPEEEEKQLPNQNKPKRSILHCWNQVEPHVSH